VRVFPLSLSIDKRDKSIFLSLTLDDINKNTVGVKWVFQRSSQDRERWRWLIPTVQ
jgi:hypothetical protein